MLPEYTNPSPGPESSNTNATLDSPARGESSDEYLVTAPSPAELEERVQPLEIANIWLKDPRADTMRLSVSKIEQTTTAELKLAALQKENMNLAADIQIHYRDKATLIDNLKSLKTDLSQLEEVLQTERVHQGNEVVDLEEQLVAFNRIVISLEAENKELKEAVQQQSLGYLSERPTTRHGLSRDIAETDRSRLRQLDEENTTLRTKLIDTLDKLVIAHSRLEKLATTQTHAANHLMPLETKQRSKRPGSVNERAAKKAKQGKHMALPKLQSLQPSSTSSDGNYLCLVPQESAYVDTREGVRYAHQTEFLTWYILEKVRSLIVELDKKGTIKGTYAWQSAVALGGNCAFCRLISERECEWYEDDRACVRCTRHKRPCVVVHELGGEQIAVLLPLHIDHRRGLKISDTGYWIRV